MKKLINTITIWILAFFLSTGCLALMFGGGNGTCESYNEMVTDNLRGQRETGIIAFKSDKRGNDSIARKYEIRVEGLIIANK